MRRFQELVGKQVGVVAFRNPVRVAAIFCSVMLLGVMLLGGMPLLGQDVPNQAPAEPDGMTRIFNGQDLSGWDGDPRLWSVKEGVIHGETTANEATKGNTFLIWQEGETADFELRLSFRCNATNNSGIQYRSHHVTDGKVNNAWVVRGYQHEIRNEVGFPNVCSFIYDEGGRRGRMCAIGEKATWTAAGEKVVHERLIDEEAFRELFRLDDWNDVIIIARGNRLQHYLNGQLVVDFTDEDPENRRMDGILALQLHAGAPMWVEFKDLRIKAFPR